MVGALRHVWQLAVHHAWCRDGYRRGQPHLVAGPSRKTMAGKGAGEGFRSIAYSILVAVVLILWGLADGDHCRPPPSQREMTTDLSRPRNKCDANTPRAAAETEWRPDMGESRAISTTVAGKQWASVTVVPTLYFVASIRGIVGTPLQHSDTRVHARCPTLAGITQPLAGPAGQTEAATAQSSSATATPAHASPLPHQSHRHPDSSEADA